MTPDAKMKLRNLLTSHEKYVQFPYVDTTGHITVGIGRNLTDRGISTNEALLLLDDDISYFSSKLAHYLNFFPGLDSNRQIALVDMCFNLGINNFLAFSGMIQALENKDWKCAHDEMLDSKWAQQVGERATQLANIILTGEL
jgi:lysozyme